MVPTMKQGGCGAFSLLASLVPRFAQKWYRACESKDWSQAEAMKNEFDRCMDALYWPLSRRGYTDVAVDKALIDCFGFLKSGDPRPPLKPVSGKDRAWAREQIRQERYFQDCS